jgi:hypothetical protein
MLSPNAENRVATRVEERKEERNLRLGKGCCFWRERTAVGVEKDSREGKEAADIWIKASPVDVFSQAIAI